MIKTKEVKPINFIYFRAETVTHELINFLPVAKELYQEAVKLKLWITGPIHWHYFGFEGDVNKPFTLEIALPVAEVPQEYDGSFHFKRTEPFKCVSVIHEGAWLEIPQSYGKLIQFASENNLQPIGNNREVYVNTDFAFPVANVTEIQMGIA